MGETRAEVRVIGQFVAQLVARKSSIDQKKLSRRARVWLDFGRMRQELLPEGSSYPLFLDRTRSRYVPESAGLYGLIMKRFSDRPALCYNPLLHSCIVAEPS